MRATWLANVLKLAGLTVLEQDGWQKRGRDLIEINGVVLHHTATTTSWSDSAVGKLLRDGRSDLPGPLAQLGLDRQGRYWLIAAGKCNHNGYGEWGNQSLGIEAFNDGKGEPWPSAQLDAWQQGTAAILRHLGLPASHALGHRETDPKRKIDPRGIDLDAFRRNVARLLTSEPEGDDLLMAAALNDDDARRCLIRQWYGEFLGRGFNDAKEQQAHLEVFRTQGADLCLAGIVDSDEASAYRKRTPDTR